MGNSLQVPAYLLEQLWGYPGNYSSLVGEAGYLLQYTVGEPGYLLEDSGGNRVPTRVSWGYPSTYASILGVPGYLIE